MTTPSTGNLQAIFKIQIILKYTFALFIGLLYQFILSGTVTLHLKTISNSSVTSSYCSLALQCTPISSHSCQHFSAVFPKKMLNLTRENVLLLRWLKLINFQMNSPKDYCSFSLKIRTSSAFLKSMVSISCQKFYHHI